MNKKTAAILDCVSTAIVNVKQQCFTTTGASLSLSVSNTKSVVISGLDMTNTASTNTSCSTTQDIGPIGLNMQALLNDVVQASQEMQGRKSTFIATIVASINVDVVNSCVASAVSAVQVILGQSDSTTIKNVSMTATAATAISKCIQSVTVSVGNMSLKDYIDSNLSWMSQENQTQDSTPAKQISETQTQETKKPVVTPEEVTAAQQKVFACDSNPLMSVWISTGLLTVVGLGCLVASSILKKRTKAYLI